MTLSVAMKTATSGLMAAQAGLRAVSDNISNVNTPGYVRKEAQQRPLVVNGVGMGVEVTGVKRITDQYLQLASLTAGSEASRWDMVTNYLDNAQALFGDPSAENFFFSRLDQVYAGFAAASDDPSSGLLRSQAIGDVQDFLTDAARINTQILELSKTMDAQISANVDRANRLLAEIDKTNVDISRAGVINADISGSENIQSQLVDELATIMNIRVANKEGGGLYIRSSEGVMLAGEGAAILTYNATDTTKGFVSARPRGSSVEQAIQITSGEIRGQMDLRDNDLPGLSVQLGEFVSRAAEQLNAAHNAAASVPARATLTGRNTGLDLPTAVTGFTGQTTIAIVNSSGVVQRRVAVDFDAQTYSIDGGGPAAFTPATFLASLNGALGAFGSAGFAGGALSLAATGGNGVAIDEGTSQKSGRAFSHFFGLNDLVRSSGMTTFETGLTASSPHGFTAGGSMTLRLAQGDGKPIRDMVINVPAAPAMSDLLASLNDNSSGVGMFGQFALDALGAMTFTPTNPPDATISMMLDTTTRGVGGPSVSELFGLGSAARTGRAGRFSVDSAIVADPMKLSLGQLDLGVAPGLPSLRPGDGRGALALSMAGDRTTGFQAAGALGAVSMTVSRYAAEFGGAIGRGAASAETRKQSADAVKIEAEARRESVEGVNLDEELVRLTTYQQAFNGSARLIQAAKELFDVLSDMI